MLTVTWDAVTNVDGYEVLYQPAAEAAGSGGTVARSSDVARSPATDDFATATPPLAVLSDDRRTAHANITGLDNGTTYDVQVRAVRTITTPSGNVTLRSALTPATGTSGVGFVVAEPPSGPRVVRSGGTVSLALELKYAPVPPRPDPLLEDLYPFANRSMGAWILTGPSTGQSVQCRPTVAPAPEIVISHVASTGDAPRVPCVTDAKGRMTLVYTSVAPSSDLVINTDHVRLYVDPNKNQQRDSGEPYVDLDPVVAIVRPINYAALGDSYSAGENGEFMDDRLPEDQFMGMYLDAECRRWTMAYPSLIAGNQNYDSFGFYACTGAVTSDVYVPAGSGNFNGQSSDLDTLNTRLGLGSQQNVDMVTITIGGNDLGFGDVLIDCFISGCGSGSLKISIEQYKTELGKVVNGLKTAAPHATIFVLGYPQLVPVPSHGFCPALTLEPVLAAVDEGYPMHAGISASRGYLTIFGPNLSISGNERAFVRDAAAALNAAISDVAEEKGVHYVHVADEFEGHEPCGDEDAWLNGSIGERVDGKFVDSPNEIPLSDRSFSSQCCRSQGVRPHSARVH